MPWLISGHTHAISYTFQRGGEKREGEGKKLIRSFTDWSTRSIFSIFRRYAAHQTRTQTWTIFSCIFSGSVSRCSVSGMLSQYYHASVCLLFDFIFFFLFFLKKEIYWFRTFHCSNTHFNGSMANRCIDDTRSEWMQCEQGTCISASGLAYAVSAVRK